MGVENWCTEVEAMVAAMVTEEACVEEEVRVGDVAEDISDNKKKLAFDTMLWWTRGHYRKQRKVLFMNIKLYIILNIVLYEIKLSNKDKNN